jgi:hypothetical protein
MPSKQHRFASFFSKNSEWNDIVLYKMRCFIKKKKHQKVSISKSVLNWDFDFKNQFNCIPVKFKCQPWSWPHFFTLVLGFEFVYFDPQFINKLSISSIWPMIWSISVPMFTRLFQFGPWFWISSIKFLIVHQTSIFMQLSPWFD